MQEPYGIYLNTVVSYARPNFSFPGGYGYHESRSEEKNTSKEN
jgi:hypothetical protein